MKPIRIQRKRTKGWQMPPNTIYCGRPGKWANPFPLSGSWIVWAAVARGFRADKPGRRAACLAFFCEWIEGIPAAGPLAKEKSGDTIVYRSGLELDAGDASRAMAADFACMFDIVIPRPPTIEDIHSELRGKNLACWCKPDEACHVDIYLEIANRVPGLVRHSPEGVGG